MDIEREIEFDASQRNEKSNKYDCRYSIFDIRYSIIVYLARTWYTISKGGQTTHIVRAFFCRCAWVREGVMLHSDGYRTRVDIYIT